MQRNSTNMDYTFALLFSLLHVINVGTPAPQALDVVNVKSKVKWLAEQLVVRLNKDFQYPPELTLSPPATDVHGLSYIVAVLEGYNSLISETLNGVHQVKSDISSLTGYLNQWRQGNCSEQRPKPLVLRPLQELQSQKVFIHTVSTMALMRVEEFLNLLLKNLDHVQSC